MACPSAVDCHTSASTLQCRAANIAGAGHRLSFCRHYDKGHFDQPSQLNIKGAIWPLWQDGPAQSRQACENVGSAFLRKLAGMLSMLQQLVGCNYADCWIGAGTQEAGVTQTVRANQQHTPAPVSASKTLPYNLTASRLTADPLLPMGSRRDQDKLSLRCFRPSCCIRAMSPRYLAYSRHGALLSCRAFQGATGRYGRPCQATPLNM